MPISTPERSHGTIISRGTGALSLAAFGMTVYLMTQLRGTTAPSLDDQASRITALESRLAELQVALGPTATHDDVTTAVVEAALETLGVDRDDTTTTSSPDTVTVSLTSGLAPTTLLTLKRTAT